MESAFPQIERCALGQQAQQPAGQCVGGGHWGTTIAWVDLDLVAGGDMRPDPWFALLEQP